MPELRQDRIKDPKNEKQIDPCKKRTGDKKIISL